MKFLYFCRDFGGLKENKEIKFKKIQALSSYFKELRQILGIIMAVMKMCQFLKEWGWG
jgi:hypothetical protein